MMTQIKSILKTKLGNYINNFGFEMDGSKVTKCYLGANKVVELTDGYVLLENSVEQYKLEFDKLQEVHFAIDHVEIIALYTPDYPDERFIISDNRGILIKLFDEEWADLLLNEFPFDTNEEEMK
jgi:hypothetical protein